MPRYIITYVVATEYRCETEANSKDDAYESVWSTPEPTGWEEVQDSIEIEEKKDEA